MSPLWALSVILLIVIVIFVILPSFGKRQPVEGRKVAGTPQRQQQQQQQQPAPTQIDDEEERCRDRDMLKSYYPPPLHTDTPVDYPRKAIGACPDSKPQKISLPASDIPMYMLKST